MIVKRDKIKNIATKYTQKLNLKIRKKNKKE